MTDQSTERARELAQAYAIPIMREARENGESSHLQWTSWHEAVVSGVAQAIADTERRCCAEAPNTEELAMRIVELEARCESLEKENQQLSESRAEFAKLYVNTKANAEPEGENKST